MGTTYDVFLVLRPFHDGLSEFELLLAPLTELGRNQVAGVDGYYSDELDTALIALRFLDSLVARVGALEVHRTIDRTGLPSIIPAELAPEDRQRFYREHLPRYRTYVQHYPYNQEPLSVLERAIRSLSEHGSVGHTPPIAPVHFDLGHELPVGGGRGARSHMQPMAPPPALDTGFARAPSPASLR